ncbi:MAG: indole-3-glycerol-phosphate synthase TrpC, partial [Pseudomonadota bacterium]
DCGLFSGADVGGMGAAGASAVLVGESLMRQDDVAAATRALLSGDAA